MLVKQVAAGDVGHLGRRLAGEAKAQVVVRHQDAIDGGVLRRLPLLQPAQQQRRVAGPQRLQAARVGLRGHAGAVQLSRRDRRAVVRREDAVADRFAVAVDGVQPFAVRRETDAAHLPGLQPRRVQRLADRRANVIPQRVHIAFAEARLGGNRRAVALGDRQLFAACPVQPGLDHRAADVYAKKD